MMKSERFRNSAKLVLGIGLIICALACAIYGILLIPVIMGLPFQWEYFALIGFAAVLVLVVSLILFGLAKVEAEHEALEGGCVAECDLPCGAQCEAKEPVRASVEISFSVPCKPVKREPVKPLPSIDCSTCETRSTCKLHKLSSSCKENKELIKKIGLIAVPTVAAGLIVWSVSTHAKYSRRAKRRQMFYRWLG